MYLKILGYVTVLLALCILGGCGGGGGTGSHSRKALTKISAAGVLPNGEAVAAVLLTVSIPLGVTVALDQATGEPAAGVVHLVSQDATDPNFLFQGVHYLAPTQTAPGALTLAVFNTTNAGFGQLDYISVQLDMSTDYTPQAADFVVSDFEVSGVQTGSTVVVANPVVSVSFN